MRGSGGGLGDYGFGVQTEAFWGADGGARGRAVLVMGGYGKSREMGGGSLTREHFWVHRVCDLSFGWGGVTCQTQKSYMFLESVGTFRQPRPTVLYTQSLV